MTASDIQVQVVPVSTEHGVTYLSPRSGGLESFNARREELTSCIATMANAMAADLKDKVEADKSDVLRLRAIELKFSVDLEAEAGVVIARTKAAAGFEVTFSWNRGGQ